MVKASPEIDQMFAALSDPTRRAVIDLLRQKPHRAGELADELQMSAAALSRHLRILRGGGLITDDEVEGDARVRLYRLQPAAFQALGDWLGEIEAFWGGQLQAFKAYAETSDAPAETGHTSRKK